ncbi:MAG: IS110 family transposase [Lentisphaeraceae bacterium]|nr:IS110 family transposase [Lentisphaeraceae bacterium]
MSKTQEIRVIGIDLHPSCFAAAAMKNQHQKLWLHPKINITDLDNWLKNNIRPSDVLVVEAGANSTVFCKTVVKFGAQCIILDSIRVGQIKKAYCKTDKEDCVKIAKCYLSGLSNKVWTPDNDTVIRREVLVKFQQAKKAVTKVKNMINSYLTTYNLAKPKGLRVYSEKGKGWLLKSNDWSPIQIGLIEILYSDLEHAIKTKKAITSIIAREVISNPRILSLLKLCGVRTLTAFALAAAVGDINRFESPKKLAAYLGLIPSVTQSGVNKRHGATGKGGRKETRTFMVQGAQAILRASDEYGAGFKAWGLKMAMAKGKNIATIAVARKMAVASWYHLMGYQTNVHIPEKSMKVKVGKMITDLGKETILELGYKNNKHFKQEIEQKILGAA